MASNDESPLGRPAVHQGDYDPTLLFPIPRAPQREAIGLSGALPFSGADLWTAYELSWLNQRGKPELAIARFSVPADSPSIVESKSVKLYLNAFSQTRFAAQEDVARALRDDLARACGKPVAVELLRPAAFAELAIERLAGESIDGLDIEVRDYSPRPDTLAADGAPVEETLVSDLFKSNCPVTGQPDWGSVQIRYRGPQIDRAGLLRYLVSFRQHTGFHEHCVERMFVDLRERCRPERLTVYARFTRRGGVDINPFRSNWEQAPAPGGRTARQ
ncbi:MAG: NADPH-dependent 7-cyano-7-deazaguanine reductase QueF [Burkholderiales bacterium]